MGHVFPGESLKLKVWKDGEKRYFEAETVERGKKAVTGVLTVREAPKLWFNHGYHHIIYFWNNVFALKLSMDGSLAIIDANFLDKDKIVECFPQKIALDAVEHASSLPLRLHSVHISKTTEIGSITCWDCPFGMILGSFPGVVRGKWEIFDISHLIGGYWVATPRYLGWSSPGLCQNLWVEHIGQSILENRAVLIPVFENDSHVAVSHSQIVVFEYICIGEKSTWGDQRIWDCKCALVDIQSGHASFGEDVPDVIGSSWEAEEMLTV